MNEIEKTCENCEYELEELEGAHCRHCIHSAEEHFKQKPIYTKIESLDEVIERLQYKADNIKAKLEPSYFTECIDYLKTLPRVEEEQEIRNKAIDEFMNKLCDHCMRQTNECYQLECPFCGDGCDVVNIAEQMKGE